MNSKPSTKLGKIRLLIIKKSQARTSMRKLSTLKIFIHRVRWQLMPLSLKSIPLRMNTKKRLQNCKIFLINSLRKEKVFLKNWPIISSWLRQISIKKKSWKKVSQSMRLNQPIKSTNLKSYRTFHFIKISTSFNTTVFKWKRTLNGKLDTRFRNSISKLK